jgi:branched-chain amino acid transport system permease protein
MCSTRCPQKKALDYDLTQLSCRHRRVLLVIMMIMRPEGLLPERRSRIELTENLEGGDEPVQA